MDLGIFSGNLGAGHYLAAGGGGGGGAGLFFLANPSFCRRTSPPPIQPNFYFEVDPPTTESL